MDLTGSSYNISQILGYVVGTLGVLAVGVQTIMKNWKSSATESSLLTLMHTELERMSGQNSTLSGEIGKLQVELIKLSNQLTRLTVENQNLQLEVSSLNGEISRLHRIMQLQTVKVDNVLENN